MTSSAPTGPTAPAADPARASRAPAPAGPRPRLDRAPAVAPSPWSVAAARWLRRVHLYSGLALLPFVLLYGVSAFLFNHGPGAGPARELVAGPALPTDADALARAVAIALDHDPGAIGDVDLTGDWTFELGDGATRQRLQLAANGERATLRPLARAAARNERVPASTFAAPLAAAEAAARAALAHAGVADAGLRRTGAPTLRFRSADRDVAVSLERGQATVRDAQSFDLGRLLMRLHTAHGYSGPWARIAWAVIVDLMAAAMVLWSVSGVVMWWQRRSHRRPGLAVVLASCVVAGVLGAALAALFAR